MSQSIRFSTNPAIAMFCARLNTSKSFRRETTIPIPPRQQTEALAVSHPIITQ